jgi:hypothetical protein
MDPQCRQVGPERQQPGGGEVARARHPLPAEKEQADERRLEKERHQPFDRQWRAEDVADVMRVVGPVRAELELHRDAGRDAHREIDAE